MSKKLLIDSFGTFKPQLVESNGNYKVFRGEFGRADVPTENKRIYPRAIWEREIQRMNQAISEGKVMGELDHPSDGKTSLKRVSHVISGLDITSDGRIVGEAKIMNNEHGRQLCSILEAGGAIGVSSRGMGSTAMNEAGYEVVQEDYSYMTHDCVADPAVKTSYPTFSLESKESKSNLKEQGMDAKTNNGVTSTAGFVSNGVPAQPGSTVTVTNGNITVQSATNLLDEATVTKRVEEATSKLTEDFKKDLESKLTEAKEQVKKELESDPKVAFAKFALEDVAKLVRPFILPEDVQAAVKEKETIIEGKDKEIADLKKLVEGLTEKCTKTAKITNGLGMLLHFEKMISEAKEKEAIRRLVGDVRRFTKHQELAEAVKGAQMALKSLVEEKSEIAKVEKALTAKFEKQLAEEKAATEKAKKAMKEAADLARQYGLKAYVLEKTKSNPNAGKILQLAEGIQTKEQADKLIEKFGVEAPALKEYNSIRKRFAHLEKTNLVEEHLKETGLRKPAQSEPVVEGVESEMVDLFPGASLEQVRDLSRVE